MVRSADELLEEARKAEIAASKAQTEDAKRSWEVLARQYRKLAAAKQYLSGGVDPKKAR